MAVFGLFFAGGTTALLGVLEYLPVKGAIDNPDMEYIIIAFTLRVANSLGNTAFDTAAMTLIAVTFPENTALTMVCKFRVLIGASFSHKTTTHYNYKNFLAPIPVTLSFFS